MDWMTEMIIFMFKVVTSTTRGKEASELFPLLAF